MAHLRTLAAGVIFLFGTTFLWFMPSFLGTGTEAEGTIWSVIQLLVLATMIGYGGRPGACTRRRRGGGRWRSAGPSSGRWCWCCGGWRSAR
jgi:hypothetical protein